jgi:hypothetical protein
MGLVYVKIRGYVCFCGLACGRTSELLSVCRLCRTHTWWVGTTGRCHTTCNNTRKSPSWQSVVRQKPCASVHTAYAGLWVCTALGNGMCRMNSHRCSGHGQLPLSNTNLHCRKGARLC